MPKLTDREWKEFKIADFFNVIRGNAKDISTNKSKGNIFLKKPVRCVQTGSNQCVSDEGKVSVGNAQAKQIKSCRVLFYRTAVQRKQQRKSTLELRPSDAARYCHRCPRKYYRRPFAS